MAVMMLISGNSSVMGVFTVNGLLRLLGWLTTAAMAAAVIAMAVTAL
jgi:hypothetical protein